MAERMETNRMPGNGVNTIKKALPVITERAKLGKLLPGLGPGTSSLPMMCATTCAKAAYRVFSLTPKIIIPYTVFFCNHFLKYDLRISGTDSSFFAILHFQFHTHHSMLAFNASNHAVPNLHVTFYAFRQYLLSCACRSLLSFL